MVAFALLGLALLLLYVYVSPRQLAWKYLLPGVLGMLVFAAFPLLYTMVIGFTNYSSSHLLTEEGSRAYLLAQFEVDDASLTPYSLHRDGAQWRIAQRRCMLQRQHAPPLLSFDVRLLASHPHRRLRRAARPCGRQHRSAGRLAGDACRHPLRAGQRAR